MAILSHLDIMVTKESSLLQILAWNLQLWKSYRHV